MPIQWWELVLILLVVLLLFGAKRVPEMGRSLGKGMREFKDAVSGNERPETSPPAALPTASVEHDEAEVEESERETVR